MIKIIINAFANDKPGLVSKITNIIRQNHGNIEISKMIQLESDFTLLLLIEIDKKNIKTLINKLDKIEDLKINYKKTQEKQCDKKYSDYLFKVNVADSEGIIYLFSNLFKQYNINIVDMDTYIKNAANTGFPIFFLKSNIIIPIECNIKKLTNDLNEVAQKNSIEYKLIRNN